MSSLLRRAEPALVPVLVLVGVVQAAQAHRSTAYAEVGWVLIVCLPLLVRRSYPATASLAVSIGLLFFTWVTGAPTPFVAAVLAFLVGFYSVGAWAERRPAATALVVGLAGFWLQDLRLHHAFGEYAASALLVAGPWAAGRALRAVRLQNQRLRELTAELERERESHARDAVLAERAQMAREMHDAVGHSLSVISLQAQGAQAALERDPSRVAQPLADIERATRHAMGEMRRLVSVLGDERPMDAPSLSLAGLRLLVGEHRASGLEVDLVLGEPPLDLPSGLEVAVYRIVQEGLTNVRRHTSATRARVDVCFEHSAARVVVVDRGPALPGGSLGGKGLAGALARAESFGGWVDAGPQGPGWTLRAHLPFEPAGT